MRTVKFVIIVVLILSLAGCAIALKSKDGNKLKFMGLGRAKFEDGSEIESKPFPDLPPISWEK